MNDKTTYRTNLRLPSILAERLKRAAEENQQSFNQEVVERLEESLRMMSAPKRAPLTAKEAKELAQQGIINSRNRLLNYCHYEISLAASKGYEEATVASDYDDPTPSIYENVILPVIKELERLEYSVQFEDGILYVSF